MRKHGFDYFPDLLGGWHVEMLEGWKVEMLEGCRVEMLEGCRVGRYFTSKEPFAFYLSPHYSPISTHNSPSNC